jgi:hypothetical protein
MREQLATQRSIASRVSASESLPRPAGKTRELGLYIGVAGRILRRLSTSEPGANRRHL